MVPRQSVPIFSVSRSPIPHFSTDIAAAWEVVEELRTQGWYFRLECVKPGDPFTNFVVFKDDEQCRASFFQGYAEDWGPKPRNLRDAAARTTPLAICLAALKAVGHKFD